MAWARGANGETGDAPSLLDGDESPPLDARRFSLAIAGSLLARCIGR